MINAKAYVYEFHHSAITLCNYTTHDHAFLFAIVSIQQLQCKGPECEDNFHLRHSGIQPTLLQDCDTARSYLFLTKSIPLNFQKHTTKI
jgi:hypothetical protein